MVFQSFSIGQELLQVGTVHSCTSSTFDKKLLTKLNNSVSMNKTNERNYTMFTSAYELNRDMRSMHRVYRFALLCSLSV